MVDNYQNIKDIKNYAIDNQIPIMEDDGLAFLLNQIIKYKPKNILEIGTAIGYSSIMMALTNQTCTITTIERDEKRYLEAIRNVKKLKLEDRITLVFKDALETNLTEQFDLIFIDAAKAQNQKIFELYEKNLSKDGIIVTDNMNFHGFKENIEEIKSRNLKALVRKIKNYEEWLKTNDNYITTFHEVGDGLAVSIKK